MLFIKICVILISVPFICGLTQQKVFNATQPLPLKLRPDSEIGPQQLVYLGTADGAIYYVERDISRNWADAKKLCEGFDIKLKLATVMSKAQYDFLMKNLQEEYYWLGAREYMNGNALRWDGTNQSPVNHQSFHIPGFKYWCLTLRALVGSPGYMCDPCSSLHPTICQLQT